MSRLKITLCLLAPLLLAAATPPLRYHIDAPRSAVSAKVGFLGIASKTAHFPQMSGRIALSPDRLDTIDLDVELDARQLTAGDKVTLGRLKGKDFFDVERHPTVRFSGRKMQMTGPVTATVAGEVTARGITRPATLAVTFRDPPARATGRDPVELTARTEIDRREFGMTAYSAIVGKKVTITIRARMVPN
ncbi:MAG: YceI family protein [Sphingomonadaceae bacterium]|nr:YceI family protein [Sphingomonadaceae bacterium]